MSKKQIMYKSEQRFLASVALNEQSLKIIGRNAIDLYEWVNEALAVYEEEKLAYLQNAYAKRAIQSLFIAPDNQSIEKKMAI